MHVGRIRLQLVAELEGGDPVLVISCYAGTLCLRRKGVRVNC